MSDPARQLRAVGDATETMHGVARQALEWVRVGEERVARAEARADTIAAQVKQRAMGTLREVAGEARRRIAAEREQRRLAESKLAGSEAARDRAEHAFEELQQRSQAEREALAAGAAEARAESERGVAAAAKRAEAEMERRL